MSKVKATEKLRRLKGEVVDYRWGVEFDRAIDALEAEIAERFVALPVDAEGDVLRIGDELKCQGESILLNSLSWDGRRWYATETVVSSGWYPVHLCRHVKPCTLEDMLRDFAHKAVRIGMKGGVPSDVKLYANEDAIAEYADEIRAMFGEVDGDD